MYLFIYMKSKVTDRFSIFCFLPQMPATVRARSNQSQEPGTPFCSPTGTQILGPFRYISRKLDEKHRVARTQLALWCGDADTTKIPTRSVWFQVLSDWGPRTQSRVEAQYHKKTGNRNCRETMVRFKSSEINKKVLGFQIQFWNFSRWNLETSDEGTLNWGESRKFPYLICF